MSFQWDRPVPPDWQADLERLGKAGDAVNWLQLVWQPGWPHDPVQRWEIYEIVPDLSTIDVTFLEALRGPDPRLQGHWVKDAVGKKEWRSDAIVSRTQWRLFHETGCFSQRTWIIQGSHGGHFWQMPLQESMFLKALGKPYETPPSGALPYADYDQRVFDRLAEYDKLRRWKQNLDWQARYGTKTQAGLYLMGDRQDEEEKWARTMLNWLDDLIESVMSDVPRSMLPGMSELPYDPNLMADAEDLERRLITETASS